jgi:hypothetical protein
VREHTFDMRRRAAHDREPLLVRAFEVRALALDDGRRRSGEASCAAAVPAATVEAR